MRDSRFQGKIPDSIWDSKQFVQDSSWCRTPQRDPSSSVCRLVMSDDWLAFEHKKRTGLPQVIDYMLCMYTI